MHLSGVLLCGISFSVFIFSATGKQTSLVILRGCEARTFLYENITVKSLPYCSKVCAGHQQCSGFNYDKSNGGCYFFSDVSKGSLTTSDAISVVLKHQKRDEETEVFRMYAGSNDSAIGVWYGRDSWSSPNYRSPLLGCWERLGVQTVTLEIIFDENDKKKIYFDGRMTSISSWFASNKVTDGGLLPLMATMNYFSIEGHIHRNFFINQSYGGCDADTGWFVVIGYHNVSSSGCPWDHPIPGPFPIILSAASRKAINWNSNETRFADHITISIKSSLLNN